METTAQWKIGTGLEFNGKWLHQCMSRSLRSKAQTKYTHTTGSETGGVMDSEMDSEMEVDRKPSSHSLTEPRHLHFKRTNINITQIHPQHFWHSDRMTVCNLWKLGGACFTILPPFNENYSLETWPLLVFESCYRSYHSISLPILPPENFTFDSWHSICCTCKKKEIRNYQLFTNQQ